MIRNIMTIETPTITGDIHVMIGDIHILIGDIHLTMKIFINFCELSYLRGN